MDGFNERQLEQLASLLATKEDVQELGVRVSDIEHSVSGLERSVSGLEHSVSGLEHSVNSLESGQTELKNSVKYLQNTVESFAGQIQSKSEEDLILKQHVTENRIVITQLADKAGVVTNF